jgi:hypothetical protein
MEKSLISEVRRYHEIMGIKPIITEQIQRLAPKGGPKSLEKGLEILGISAEKTVGRGEQLLQRFERELETNAPGLKTELESIATLFERGSEREATEKLERMLQNEPFRRAFAVSVGEQFPEILTKEADDFVKAMEQSQRDALTAIYKEEGSEGVEKFLKDNGLWKEEYAALYRAFKPAEELASEVGGKVEQGAEKEWERILRDSDDMAWKKPEYRKFKALLRKSFPKASESELNAIVAKLKKSSATTKEEFAQEMDNLMTEFAPKYTEKLASQSGKLTPMERWSEFYESLNSLPFPMNKVAKLGFGLAGTYGLCEAFLLAMKLFGVSNQTCVGFVGSVLAKLGTSEEGIEEVKRNLSGGNTNQEGNGTGNGTGTGTVLANDDFYKRIISVNPKLSGLIEKAGQNYYLVLGTNNYPVYDSGGVIMYKGGDNKEYPITALK